MNIFARLGLTLCIILGILMSSCNKDEIPISSTEPLAELRNQSSRIGAISELPQNVNDRIDRIFRNCTLMQDTDFGSDFHNIVGNIRWDLATVLHGHSTGHSPVIVPVIINSKINSFFMVFDGETASPTYSYVDKHLISAPFFVLQGTAIAVYLDIFTFYETYISSNFIWLASEYTSVFEDNPEHSGCYTVIEEDMACSCDPSHSVGSSCNCASSGGTGPCTQTTVNYDSACGDPSTNSGPNTTGGGGGGGGGNGTNGTDPKLVAAMQYMWSVCPLISQQACGRLEYIIDNASNSSYCLNIPMQVANLLSMPGTTNRAAAECFILNTTVQINPSSPNTCSNPNSDEPLTTYATMFGEMNSDLVSWARSYDDLSSMPCELTNAGYTSAEKNQIMQAFSDFLGPVQNQNAGGPSSTDNDVVVITAMKNYFANNNASPLIPYIEILLADNQFLQYFANCTNCTNIDVLSTILNLVTDNNSDFNVDDQTSSFLTDPMNVDILMELYDYSKTMDGKSSSGAASLGIYASLANADLLNISTDDAYSDPYIIALKAILQHYLTDEQNELSASAWFAMAKTNKGDGGWLPSIKEVISTGWEIVILPFKLAMEPIISQLEANDLPATSEEWKAILAVYGPMLAQLGIDIGTDFIPIVGEIKGLTKTGIEISNGNYGAAAFEFIGAIAGILPIGDLIKGGTKAVDAAVTIFATFKVVKALAKASSGIYTKLIELANAGWKIVWDSAVKKMKFKNADNVDVAEIVDDVDDLSPNIIVKTPAGTVLLLTNSIKHLDEVDISSTAQQSLANAAKKNPANHMRFTPDSPAQKSTIDDILANGDKKGKKTEALLKDHLEQGNWKHQEGGHYGSDNGYDNVFFNEETGEVLIDESKQWYPVLSGSNPDTELPKQMSDDWIEHVRLKILPNDPVLAQKILDAKNAIPSKLYKTVSSVKHTTPGKGSIVTIRVN